MARKPPETGQRLVAAGKGAWIQIEAGDTCPAPRGPKEEIRWGSKTCQGCKYRTKHYQGWKFVCLHPNAPAHSARRLKEALAKASEYERELAGGEEPAPVEKRPVKQLDHGLEPKQDKNGQLSMFD